MRADGVVVVARHGETEWSATLRHTGRTDVALTQRGREQAEALAVVVGSRRFAQVLTSPLQRAAETCRLAGVADATVVDDLVEWDYGEVDGLTTPQIRERLGIDGWSAWTHGAPGGESVAQVSARADRVVERLLASEGDVLVFSHGHLLRAVAARWAQLDLAAGRRLMLETGRVGVLGFDRGLRAIESWNLLTR